MSSHLVIAARIASSMSQPLSERPDYGTRQMVSQEECQDTVSQEKESIIRKTPGKGYCVKSEDNPDWSGGCFPSKSEAKDRLKQVEYFKHKSSSSFSTSMDEAHDAVSKTITNGCKVDSRVMFSDTDGDNKEAVVLKIGLENWEGRPSALIRTEDGRELIRPISKLQEIR